MGNTMCECGRPNTLEHFCLIDEFAKDIMSSYVRKLGLPFASGDLGFTAVRIYDLAEAMMAERMRRRKENAAVQGK